MNMKMEVLFAPWVIEKMKKLRDNSSPFTCTIWEVGFRSVACNF